jgi:hypothetical protein
MKITLGQLHPIHTNCFPKPVLMLYYHFGDRQQTSLKRRSIYTRLHDAASHRPQLEAEVSSGWG